VMLKHQRKRAIFLGLCVLGLFGVLVVQVVHLQLGDQTERRAKYRQRKIFRQELAGRRGRVMDRNGRVLALDVGMRHIAVDARYIHRHGDPLAVQMALARFLKMEPAAVGSRLANPDRQFEYVSKYVGERQALELDAFLQENSLKRGVLLEEVSNRTYPHGSLLCHVLGFANREGLGAAGIELAMDRYLKGQGGLRVSEKDGHRREMVSRRSVQIDATNGADVRLTIDQYLQFAVEEALRNAMELSGAKGAWAVVLESRTGAILAMASKPDYDLNSFYDAPEETMRNRCLGMVYEPGSIIKPLVFAAALNEGLVNPNEMIDCEQGVWIFRKRPLRDFHAYAQLTAADVLKKSSNIGTAKIGLRLSERKFYDYMRAFGIGHPTGVELPGEEGGIFSPTQKWDSLTQSRVSIGHSVSVTAMQMAVSMNAIASDGQVLRPYLIHEVVDAKGSVLFRQEPEPMGQAVIRPDVAKKMRELMARITEPGGTGRRAAIEGYEVAGKTGTAEKIINGQYSDTKNIASFAGFLPARNPVITVVVSIDEPQGEYRTGGVVAGPVFRQIGEEAIRYLGIPPEGF
jgi:cell division protein FtsI (penicillin-binding protein 3)